MNHLRWRTFLTIHLGGRVFVVQTVSYRILYFFFLLRHDRRQNPGDKLSQEVLTDEPLAPLITIDSGRGVTGLPATSPRCLDRP